MHICSTCVLDENFPGISFNDNGVCIFCQRHKKKEEQRDLREKYKKKFDEIIEKKKGEYSYDCLAAFSGGKDSTYTLYLMKKRYNLNVLTLSYDNWFQSETALNNIKQVVKNLEIDHLMFKPTFNIFKKIIQTVISSDVYSIKALERASSICTTCISLIRFMCLKTAIESLANVHIFAVLSADVIKMNLPSGEKSK